ncbi:MAG: VWA domain-containing protein [Prochloraceae cyanobacterium]|nr:VWA domain-containing protein [Prochloraceae cyanobacterium]
MNDDLWQRVKGTLGSGHKVASGQASNSPYPRGTIEMQTPFFKKLGLNLTEYFKGTLNLSLVLDRSGSMAGQPLRYAIAAAQNLIDFLTPEDYFSLVIYDDNVRTVLQPQQVTDRQAIKTQINRIRSGGLTNLSGGWLMGCDHVKSQQTTEKINRVLLLTDGKANVGITQPSALINTAKEKAEEGIITTTLGFGNNFNEDLLIGMADAAGGNFYYIQSPDDAAEVFRIEMESLVSLVAQNLTLTLELEKYVEIKEVLNEDRSQVFDDKLELFLGNVYEREKKSLALQLSINVPTDLGQINLANLAYKYQTVVDENIQEINDRLPIEISVASDAEASNIQPNTAVLEQTNQLRIAKVKDEAIALADKGNYQQASEKLRQTVKDLKLQALDESFEIAEEIEQLDHYAQNIESRRFDRAIRKEMRDQSYQARSRGRSDLKLRGIAAGSAISLEGVSDIGDGVLLKCDRIGGKLRVRVISEGYNPEFNVQFPRNIRQEGVTYVVDEVARSAKGNFYRASGNIRQLVEPGRERPAGSISSPSRSQPQQLKAIKAPKTAADLETVTTVGDGILIQCVQDGKKLRARVVSDGYDPNYNVRFPRSIREEGILFVVDAVKEASQGGSYIALGKVRRLEQ